jgi:hypothetical protein
MMAGWDAAPAGGTRNPALGERRRLPDFPPIHRRGMKPLTSSFVMAGPVPATHVLLEMKDVDARHKAGHDRL